LLYLLFAVVALGEECESSTCVVCKTNSSCDWYGFDCLLKTGTAVSSLGLSPTATCSTCQAGSCLDCTGQPGCAWFSSVVPGVPGKCTTNTSSPSGYNVVPVCPTCYLNTTCDTCVVDENVTGCGWYVLPGGVGGKCREASPSFAYSKVPAGKCATGNPCAGVRTCSKCQEVVNATNSSTCSWYTSSSPSFYNSKCDDNKPGIVDAGLYTVVTGQCPICAGTSCLDCQAEGLQTCRWVAVQGLTGIGFGECLANTVATPSTKRNITTCPATCQVHSCKACTALATCSWFQGGGSFVDDSCDLTSDSKMHLTQTQATIPCAPCKADRCYECNSESGCGWYANKILGQIVAQGCYPNTQIPSGRVLIANSDSKCKGVPASSAHVVASLGLVFVLSLAI